MQCAHVPVALHEAKDDSLKKRGQVASHIDHEMNENDIVADLINDPVFAGKGLPETVLEEALKLGGRVLAGNWRMWAIVSCSCADV
jgi:hypothetical protein